MARHFNGSSDSLTFSMTTALESWRFGTIAAVVKRGNNTSWNGPITRRNPSSPSGFLDIAPTSHATNNALWAAYSGTSTNSTATKVLDTDGWVIVAASKPTGTSIVRFHLYKFSTSTWVHANGASKADAAGAAGGSIVIGTVNTDWFVGDIDAAAFFPSNLSDANIETLATSLSAWDSLSPAGMWVLDQTDVTVSVTDRTGNGSNQTARSGTTIASSSSPLTTPQTQNFEGWGVPI